MHRTAYNSCEACLLPRHAIATLQPMPAQALAHRVSTCIMHWVLSRTRHCKNPLHKTRTKHATMRSLEVCATIEQDTTCHTACRYWKLLTSTQKGKSYTNTACTTLQLLALSLKSKHHELSVTPLYCKTLFTQHTSDCTLPRQSSDQSSEKNSCSVSKSACLFARQLQPQAQHAVPSWLPQRLHQRSASAPHRTAQQAAAAVCCPVLLLKWSTCPCPCRWSASHSAGATQGATAQMRVSTVL
jgi:hypothetical protein